jgi:hypothetical protein
MILNSISPMSAISRRGASALVVDRILALLVLTCLGLQALHLFHQAANWDEYRFLADVHLSHRGALKDSLQTFHVHLFGWLLWLPGNELDQIMAARLVMLGLQAGIATMIYRCARLFADHRASLLAVLCYLGTAYVARHGASFRFDPIATFLLMAALTVVARAPLVRWTMAIAGGLVAIAALVTMKSIFYVPALVAFGCWRVSLAEEKRSAWRALMFGGTVGAVVLILLYLFHRMFLVNETDAATLSFMSHSSDTMVGGAGFFPGVQWFVRSLVESPANWLAFLGSIAHLLVGMTRRPVGVDARKMALLSLAFPLFTILFYRNAYPYYYAFMLAPAAVLAAPALQIWTRHLPALLTGAALVLPAAFQVIAAPSPVLGSQQRTIDAIHMIFPKPVAYIDRCSMIASFRKSGFFMSSWVTESYRAGGPIMDRILVAQRPAFVLMNSPILDWAMAGVGADKRMLPQDSRLLRQNFIHHWGPIWVAGKNVPLASRAQPFTMLIAARYTIEAATPVVIDGASYRPGDTLWLAHGVHRVQGEPGDRLTLRWGDHLRLPPMPPPGTPLFQDF